MADDDLGPDDDRAHLDGMVDHVRALRPTAPMRARLAADLVTALAQHEMARGPIPTTRWIDQIDALIAIADRELSTNLDWRRTRANARLLAVMASILHGGLSDAETALTEIDQLAIDIGDTPAARMLVESARMTVSFHLAGRAGDDTPYVRMTDYLDRLRPLAAGHPQAQVLADLIGRMSDLLTIRHQGGDVMAAVNELAATANAQLPGNSVSTYLSATQAALAAVLPQGSDQWSPERLAALERFAERDDIDDGLRSMLQATAGGAMLELGEASDLGRIDAGIEKFRTAIATATPGSTEHVFHLAGLGMALLRRREVTNDEADIRAAAEVVEQARYLAGGPQHPCWSLISEARSQIALWQGSTDAAASAVDGLRSNAWKVLLQSDSAAARYAARDAADSAIGAAQLCLADSDTAGAIQALDGGRSLMLFAAAQFRDVAPRLRQAGHDDLADRWQAARADDPSRMPVTLRHEVLSALTEASDILTPPSLPQISAALRTLDADALVYLVPALRTTAGFAVIAPAEGPPSFFTLPGLRMEGTPDVEQYLNVLAGRGEPDRDIEAPLDLAGSLDALAGWAWRVVVGPLVERYLPRLPEPANRPYRLVLVPMGELALIPWQAARKPDGTYAVADVAFSFAASARLLCETAAAAPVPRLPVGLIVGDPDIHHRAGQLTAARAEAAAIHQAFYRGGKYIGTRGDGTPSPAGAGTTAEVSDWLTNTRPSAGGMLHLACHGVIDTDPQRTRSYLMLAGDDELTAERIVELLAKAPNRAIGLAVLAACRTGRSVHGYDEAYSLGTAFLASGVRSVLSTQWGVPDRATSLLMFMFHHYLMAKRRPAWAALREAQLWMLDPNHEAPPTMPEALRRQLDDAETERIDAWAGFIHMGQ